MKNIEQWIKEKTAGFEDVGTIPIEHAGICWDLTRSRESKPRDDLHVLDLREARKSGTEEHRIWKAAGSTLGACIADWKNGNNARHTPLGIIAEMAYDGTLPKGQSLDRILQQFAKIEGCDWALQMATALRMDDFITDGDEEVSL